MKKKILILLGITVLAISCGGSNEAKFKKDAALLKETLTNCENGKLKKEDKTCDVAKKVQQDLAKETWNANKKDIEEKLNKIVKDVENLSFESNIDFLPPKVFEEKSKELGIEPEKFREATLNLLKSMYTQQGNEIKMEAKFDLENAKIKRTIEGRTYGIVSGETKISLNGADQNITTYTVIMEDIENKGTWYAFNLEPTFLTMIQKSYPDLKELDLSEIGK